MIVRRHVGEPMPYKGRMLTATMIGPDLLAYVDAIEMPHFYQSLTAARKAGMRYVDEEIRTKEKQNA